MSTQLWINLWTAVLYGALAAFTLLSTWVIIFGLRDIRRLLRELREE